MHTALQLSLSANTRMSDTIVMWYVLVICWCYYLPRLEITIGPNSDHSGALSELHYMLELGISDQSGPFWGLKCPHLRGVHSPDRFVCFWLETLRSKVLYNSESARKKSITASSQDHCWRHFYLYVRKHIHLLWFIIVPVSNPQWIVWNVNYSVRFIQRRLLLFWFKAF